MITRYCEYNDRSCYSRCDHLNYDEDGYFCDLDYESREEEDEEEDDEEDDE